MCMLVPHNFLSWPAGQDWRNEQSVCVEDEQEGAGLRNGRIQMRGYKCKGKSRGMDDG